jgi:uncharacterized protein (DUF1697 family)
MPVAAAVSLLRAVNVGGRQIQKDALVAIHEAAGCVEPKTFIASGNLVFTTREKKLDKLAERIEAEFERVAGFRSEAMLRTLEELRGVVERNPFAARMGSLDGSKLLVVFLASAPAQEAIAAAMAIDVAPEEMHVIQREMYIYFPDGQGRSKFPSAKVNKALGSIPGTGRNWNTVLKLIDLAAAR